MVPGAIPSPRRHRRFGRLHRGCRFLPTSQLLPMGRWPGSVPSPGHDHDLVGEHAMPVGDAKRPSGGHRGRVDGQAHPAHPHTGAVGPRSLRTSHGPPFIPGPIIPGPIIPRSHHRVRPFMGPGPLSRPCRRP